MKQIKVLNQPATWVEVPDDADEEQARVEWEKKYHKQTLSDEQKRREAISVRQGKVEQRKYYK
jgi:hypothetical protein